MSPDDGAMTRACDRITGATGRGAFVAVVGPSGAGKDTLLRLVAEARAGDGRFVFARRVVTREALAEVEDHDVLSPEGFETKRSEGAFCLSWQAHRLSYGLPVSLAKDLADGRVVVANVSRRILAEAAARFERLVVVEVTAPQDVLVERIAARGRETKAEIAARMARQVELTIPSGTEAVHRISNDGAPEAGARRLDDILLCAWESSRG